MSEHPEPAVPLTSAPTETEASIIVAALEADGIRANLSREITSGLRAGPWGWVQIFVAEEDLPRAQDILDRVKQQNEDIDWSQVDVGEPEDET